MESFLFLLIVVVVVWALLKGLDSGQGVVGSTPRAGWPRADLSVAQLTQTLQGGDLPAPVQVSFPLQHGEVCVGVVDADVEQWLEGEGSYTHKYVGWAGGLTGLAIGSAMSAAGNARRRAAAAREAAERWRLIGHYRIYVTTDRIAFEGGGGREWHEMWLRDVRRIERDQATIIMQCVGQPATRLHAAPTDYWYMLMRRLAIGELPGGQATA